MSTPDAAGILIIQEEWDGYIEDILVHELERNDLAYDLVTDVDEAMALLEDTPYPLILTEPFLAEGEDGPVVRILPLIDLCAKRMPKTRILVISTGDALEGDLYEQLDQSNVVGIHGKPIDAESLAEIKNVLDDLT